jgi:hypothetical protein
MVGSAEIAKLTKLAFLNVKWKTIDKWLLKKVTKTNNQTNKQTKTKTKKTKKAKGSSTRARL